MSVDLTKLTELTALYRKTYHVSKQDPASDAPKHEIRVQTWRKGKPHTVACSCGYVPKHKIAAQDIDPEDDLAMHIAMHTRGATLLNREITSEEREIEALEARPGYWYGRSIISQEDTDRAIAIELLDFYTPAEERDELSEVIKPFFQPKQHQALTIRRQLGGIHSDPMIRVLAFRAWGRRDLDFGFPLDVIDSDVRGAMPTRPMRDPAPTPRSANLHDRYCTDEDCDGQCTR